MNRPPINILDRPLGGRGSRSTTDNVSLSAFAYMYSELVQYHQNRVDSISELERRMESSGFGVGLKVLELLAYRSREYKRETRLMNVLQFVSTQVWKALFNKPADSLERSIDHADEFMIVDYEPITSTFVSVPADFGQLSVDAYISGMIAGILSGAGFHARVTAHSVRLEEGEHTNTSGSSGGGGGGSADASQHHHHLQGSGSGVGSVSSLNPVNLMGSSVIVHNLPPRKDKAVFLVKFSPEVLARDAAMDR